MDEERKKTDQQYQPPFNPFLGLDLGERWGREIGELSQRVSHIEVAVAKLDAKVDRLEAKFDALEAKVDRLEAKFDALEAKVYALDAKVDALDAKVDKLAFAVQRLDERLNDNTRLSWGLFTAILLAIIAQKLI